MNRLLAALLIIFAFAVSSVSDARMVVNPLIGFAGKQAGVAVTPLAIVARHEEIANNQTTHTSSSFSIGTAPGAGQRRFVLVAVGAVDISSTVPTVTSVTAGGQTASAISGTSVGDTTGDDKFQEFYIAEVSTGTTATAVVVWSGGTDYDTMIVAYTITGGDDFAGGTHATDTAVDTGGQLEPTGTLNLLADGAVVAVSIADSAASVTTWTGTAGVVEDFDDATTITRSAASLDTPSNASGATATADRTAAGDSAILSIASFGPAT